MLTKLTKILYVFVYNLALLPKKMRCFNLFNSKYEIYCFLKKFGVKIDNLKILPFVCCFACIGLSFKIVDFMKSIKIVNGKVVLK